MGVPQSPSCQKTYKKEIAVTPLVLAPFVPFRLAAARGGGRARARPAERPPNRPGRVLGCASTTNQQEQTEEKEEQIEPINKPDPKLNLSRWDRGRGARRRLLLLFYYYITTILIYFCIVIIIIILLVLL